IAVPIRFIYAVCHIGSIIVNVTIFDLRSSVGKLPCVDIVLDNGYCDYLGELLPDQKQFLVRQYEQSYIIYCYLNVGIFYRGMWINLL
ncbi:MAG: hypothetical protein Q4A76_06500, partial [Porphyromonadaceae bacterium]|nr:hypothetical protein [Porphyromonadaceae bacterium]